jgi:uncharacterized protein (TIGR02145 family)
MSISYIKQIRHFLPILTLLFLFSFDLNAQSFEWAKGISGNNNNISYSIKNDAIGNSYMTGQFQGTATFDTIQLTSYGGYDIFIAKYSPSGNFLWAKHAGGIADDRGYGISVDTKGNIFITGCFAHAAVFDTIQLMNNDLSNATHFFIARYDQNGNCLWAKKAEGKSSDFGSAIAIDANSNCYVTGSFSGTPTFDTVQFNCYGLTDIFIAKYDIDGNFIWAKQAGGDMSDAGHSISVDAYGNSFVTGEYEDTSKFGTFKFYGFGDFIAKYDPDGNCLWAKGFKGNTGLAISIDNHNNIYFTGQFEETATFDSIQISGYVTHPSTVNIFIAKCDPNGNCLWAKPAGSSQDDVGQGISVDTNGNCYVTGYFGGTVAFGTFQLTTYHNHPNIFIAKYNSLGNCIWVKNAGGIADTYGYAISNDNKGNIYCTGSYNYGPATFDSIQLPVSGAFIAKILNDPLIVEGPLLLKSPVGGESWLIDSTYKITWEISNAINTRIDYTTDNGLTWLNIIPSIPTSVGSYNWIIPNKPSTNCKVRISNVSNPDNNSSSSKVFRIYRIPITPCPGIPSVNYNGQTYNTIAIGNQCWLKENLNIGTMIDLASNPSDNEIIEKYCYYDDSVNCLIYGGLYKWNEAMQYDTTEGAKGICPTGWHIPTLNDFSLLKANVSYNSNDLKDLGQGSGVGTGTNASGFSALLAGTINRGAFASLGSIAAYWCSKAFISTYANTSILRATDTTIFGSYYPTDMGESIRCINDSSLSALPVELTSFTASIINNNVKLDWNTATEINSSSYDIERKLANNTSWQKIASVIASGSSSSPKQYSFTDKKVNTGKYNYRLKLVDLDGSSKYSNIIIAEIVAPLRFELSNAYPNPWNPTTTIRYQVPVNIMVTIKVFDALGREVSILVNEVKPAGNYEVTLNGHNLASGIYYYQMKAGNFIATKKITLLK